MKSVLVLVAVLALGAAAHDADESLPFLEIAQQVLQSTRGSGGGGGQGLAAVGGLLQSFMASDSGRQIGDMLLGGKGAGRGGGGAADILSGLGSLLGQAGGAGGLDAGLLDPGLLGHVVDLFAKGAGGDADDAEEGDDGEVDENNNVRGRGRRNEAPGVDWGAVLGAASSLLTAGHGHHQDEELSPEHQGHHVHSHSASLLPPFLDKLYDMWEHFSQSELGRTLWEHSGLGALLQLFTDPETGRFQTDRIFASLENASFRRRWIRSLSSFVAEWVKRAADPATQARYVATAQFVGNSFLKAQGYNKAALFDPARPAESLSHLANAVFKRHFGLKVNAATYIKPAVAYIQDVLRLGQSKGLSLAALSSADIESRLEDTINGELVEPVLRVWRAYRYSTRVPQCDAYVLCVVNRLGDAPHDQGAHGLKPGVTKLSSMVAAWFLSGSNTTPFWKLYNAAVEDHNCQSKYQVNDKCQEFHEEDIRATTEYAHNEL